MGRDYVLKTILPPPRHPAGRALYIGCRGHQADTKRRSTISVPILTKVNTCWTPGSAYGQINGGGPNKVPSEQSTPIRQTEAHQDAPTKQVDIRTHKRRLEGTAARRERESIVALEPNRAKPPSVCKASMSQPKSLSARDALIGTRARRRESWRAPLDCARGHLWPTRHGATP